MSNSQNNKAMNTLAIDTQMPGIYATPDYQQMHLFEARYLWQKDTFILKGWSTGEDPARKYHQIEAFLQKNKQHLKSIHFLFEFDIFDASTAKYLFRIFRALNEIQKLGGTTSVHWICEEQDLEMIDTGLDFMEFYDGSFSFQLK